MEIITSGQPSRQPTELPSEQPSQQPTSIPTKPSGQPTCVPTKPSGQPSSQPTNPTGQPSRQPSSHPTAAPTLDIRPGLPFVIKMTVTPQAHNVTVWFSMGIPPLSKDASGDVYCAAFPTGTVPASEGTIIVINPPPLRQLTTFDPLCTSTYTSLFLPLCMYLCSRSLNQHRLVGECIDSCTLQECHRSCRCHCHHPGSHSSYQLYFVLLHGSCWWLGCILRYYA